ncbi:MAG TPA: glutathione transferase GstA [Burkholderiaceae bacterium]|nr:glutathione transferase GstA [Burkholderiaceae bacterium]
MKLYYSPGACSLSPHIALIEAGLPFEAIKADLSTKKADDGNDLMRLTGKGQVPVLVLDDGTVLSEGPAVVQWIADQVPEKNLAPRWGTPERYQLISLLNFLTSDIHKTFGPLFSQDFSEEVKDKFRALLGKKFDWLVQRLGDQSFLLSDQFTVADAYLFTMLGWTKHVGIDLSKWPKLVEYQARIGARPSVRTALQAEHGRAH